MRFFQPVALLLGPLLALVGCGHMPFTTMIRMRNFDFATFEPAHLRVAVRISDKLLVRRDGVTLAVTIEQGTRPPVLAQFALRELHDVQDLAPLEPFRTRGTRIFAYAASAADAERIRALQTESRDFKAANPGQSRLTVKISASGCRRGALPGEDLTMTIYVRPDVQTDYLVFLRDIDLRTQVGVEASNIPECQERDLHGESPLGPT